MVSASRRGFPRLSRVLPTSQVFTSGYVNTETILHFFNVFLLVMNRKNKNACTSCSNKTQTGTVTPSLTILTLEKKTLLFMCLIYCNKKRSDR